MRKFLIKVCGENQNKFHGAYISFRQSFQLRDNYKKYDIAGEDIDDVMYYGAKTFWFACQVITTKVKPRVILFTTFCFIYGQNLRLGCSFVWRIMEAKLYTFYIFNTSCLYLFWYSNR